MKKLVIGIFLLLTAAAQSAIQVDYQDFSEKEPIIQSGAKAAKYKNNFCL